MVKLVDKNTGQEYEGTPISSGGGGALVAIVVAIAGIFLFLPTAIVWFALFKWGKVKNSLSFFKRCVLLAWAAIIFYPLLPGLFGIHFYTKEVFIGTIIPVAIIAISGKIAESKGLNFWTETENPQYKSVSRAVGIASLTFLVSYAVLFYLSTTNSVFYFLNNINPDYAVLGFIYLVPILVSLITYFVVENFL